MNKDSFLKILLKLAWPMMMQNIISFAVQTLDSVMVGLLGDNAVSAVSLANQPYFIFTTISFGLASGGSVLISQYWGNNDREKIKDIITVMLIFSAVISIGFGLFCFFQAESILYLFAKDADVISLGTKYLQVVVFSYLFGALSNSYLSALKATENVRISTRVFCSSFIVNLIMNYILIFGKLGFPAMGITGAAVGTIIARVYECAVCVYYAKYREKEIRYSFFRHMRIKRDLLPVFFRISIPVILHDMIWSLAASTQIAIIGNMNTLYVTAASIASIAQQVGMLFLYGLCAASSIMVGKEIGAGRSDNLKNLVMRFIQFAAAVGIAGCIMILLFKNVLLLMYPNISDVSRELTTQMVYVQAFATILISVEYIFTIGILRGAGDTVFAFLTDCICIWLIGIPSGFAAANLFHLPVIIVYALFRVDSIFKIILCMYRVKSGKYIKRIVSQT